MYGSTFTSICTHGARGERRRAGRASPAGGRRGLGGGLVRYLSPSPEENERLVGTEIPMTLAYSGSLNGLLFGSLPEPCMSLSNIKIVSHGLECMHASHLLLLPESSLRF